MLTENIFKFLGGFAIMIMVISDLPQIIHIFITKRSNDVSFYTLLMKFIAIIMVLIYAFYFNLWEIFIPNVISFILTNILLIMKYYYRGPARAPTQEKPDCLDYFLV